MSEQTRTTRESRRAPTQQETAEALAHLSEAIAQTRAALSLLQNRRGIAVRLLDRLLKVMHALEVAASEVRDNRAMGLSAGAVVEAWLRMHSVSADVEEWLRRRWSQE